MIGVFTEIIALKSRKKLGKTVKGLTKTHFPKFEE